ncbi:MAG: glycosyl transferase [Prevotella sp.]|nr:glycosyl transferase [Prevotella sp.]
MNIINRINKKALRTFAPLISDRVYLKLLFPLCTGYKLNLDNPQTYNEKLQWLKLYDRRPEYVQMVDKAEAKKYVAGVIGEEHIIPTIAVYNHAEDIDFDALPDQFVLKCTHDSGGVVICRDKSQLNRKEAVKKLSKALKVGYFYQNREWPYKNVVPRIIAEKYITNDGNQLIDYKWFCFDGQPQFMFIATDRYSEHEETKFDFYDMSFQHLPFTNGHPNASIKLERPIGFETMKQLAAKLSQGMPQVRVDFYDVNGQIFFGEITFFHWSGMKPFVPSEWDLKFGQYIHLPDSKAM